MNKIKTENVAHDSSVGNKYRPTVEHYFSDESDHDSTLPTRQANVSTKRSRSRDEGSTKAFEQDGPVQPSIDLKSDSGYSSNVHQTAPGSHLPGKEEAIPRSSRSPARLARSTSPSENTSHLTTSTRRQTPRRRPVVVLGPPAVIDDCTDPNCTQCGPNALPQRRRIIPEISDQRSHRSDPTPYHATPVTTYYDRPPYVQDPYTVQHGQTRCRSSYQTRPPPQSVTGNPSDIYWTPSMLRPYPSLTQGRRPQPFDPTYGPSPPPPISPYTANSPYSYSQSKRRSEVSILPDRSIYSARYATPPGATSSQPQTEAGESSSEYLFSSEEEYASDGGRRGRALRLPPKVARSATGLVNRRRSAREDQDGFNVGSSGQRSRRIAYHTQGAEAIINQSRSGDPLPRRASETPYTMARRPSPTKYRRETEGASGYDTGELRIFLNRAERRDRQAPVPKYTAYRTAMRTDTSRPKLTQSRRTHEAIVIKDPNGNIVDFRKTISPGVTQMHTGATYKDETARSMNFGPRGSSSHPEDQPQSAETELPLVLHRIARAYVCECCPTKPKTFDSEDELR
jgi:hypothetical protein